jgi:hypothetical protein
MPFVSTPTDDGTLAVGLSAGLAFKPWRIVLPIVMLAGACFGLVINGMLGLGM